MAVKLKPKRWTRKMLLVALEVIERIVGDDSCTDWEMADMNKKFRGEKKQMVDKIRAVYRFAHSVNENHTCFHVHDKWREELLTARRDLEAQE